MQGMSKGFIEKMEPKDITLVVHDWDLDLGFHYAMRNEDKISGIAFMESILFPLESWDMFPAVDEELLNNAFKARIQATLDCVGIYAKLCHENRTIRWSLLCRLLNLLQVPIVEHFGFC